MRTGFLLVVFAALFAVACSDSSQEQAGTTEPKVARWELDEDANVAVPVCPGCGELAERPGATCAQCGTHYVVEPKEIPCPECTGNAKCIHCGDGGDERRDFGRRFIPPNGIAQGDHVIDRPGIVGHDVAQDGHSMVTRRVGPPGAGT